MGCGASLLQRTEPAESKVAPMNDSRVKAARSPLTKDQINSRIVCSPKAAGAKITDRLTIQYAFVSQRGYYPDALDKPNQDAYTIIPSFNGDESKMYFGVYDGHGTTGDLCSMFAKKECPERLIKILEKKYCSFLEAYSKSFEDTNAKLHASRIDDSLSGTTAICMFLDHETIHVANVGDSRAVIATMNDGKLTAQPLSVDQTPYRSDERERVKRSGARVLTMDQLEGIAPVHDNWAANLNDQVDEDGDPPRIWSPYGAFPGTAFTRSIGDEIAETLGVIAVPEITSLQLTEDDRFVVIASDGVFEFLTSQAVVDMVAQYDDPLEACQKVVAESYRLWLTYELRTDDISIICVYFKFSGDSLPKRDPRQQSGALDKQQLRPVRRGMSKEKRRAQMRKDMAQLVKEEDLAYHVRDHTIPKTDEEMGVIHRITRDNWLFRQLTQSQKEDIYAVMERIVVRSGDVVIKQGDPGDKFYIVEAGSFQVTVRSDEDEHKESVVHTYMEKQQKENQYASFGELALMHNSPRSSSVIALSPGVLWGIDCRAFRRVFIKAPTSVLVQTLKKVDVLKTLTQSQLERLANNLTEVTFQDGDYIINQGDVGNTFYVIQEGAVICTIWEEDASTKKKTSREVLRLKKNQYFGERALLNDAPRAANVISVGRTKLLQVGRREFEEVLGSLQDMIEADRQQREARHNFETAVKNLIYSPAVRRNSIILGPLRPQDMKFRCVVQTTDTGYLAIYQGVSESHRFYTVNVFALRQVKKDKKVDEVIKYLTVHRTIRLDTPLIPEMVTTWKDDRAFYISFDATMVTELASLLAEEKQNRLSEDVARVYAAQCLLMLEYIHNAGYAYRNLSSDNLMVDTKGYLQLHDFRHMKKLPDEMRTYTICGTPEYMAPEMVSARGHTACADIWALGILIYELLNGQTPFAVKEEGLNEKDVAMAVYSKISRHHSKEDLVFVNEDLSSEAKELIKELLNPIAEHRFGGQGIVDIKKGGSVIRAHPWFNSIDWVVLASKTQSSGQSNQLQRLFEENLSAGTEMPELERYIGEVEWLENF
ncbi:hypothetical protein Poli38472_004538 [Pythium oligandrum]|uniref:protein-serine/threonine phosphatase n=1 Tax=Pythium oligandrum TaxID=41045 RepID=A0A8K1CA04_PYTOL|nr:hypothetical protein Poli38472_004538 [Pythium oligandrum]|eukprot:TMW59469.1 hypothetical protein Poli38472_004538 [Pythium oligandrum]